MCVRAQCQRRSWKDIKQQAKPMENRKLAIPKKESPDMLGKYVRKGQSMGG